MILGLFQTRGTLAIFVSYMALFVNLGQLITASKGEDGKLIYNPITLVLLVEICKLMAAVFIFCREDGHSLHLMWTSVLRHKHVFLYYFVPAGLYALYNILTYVNLEVLDPTTYFVLLQLRVIVTGVVFQIIFKQQLSRIQWGAIFLLLFGCVLKQWNFEAGQAPIVLDSRLVLILLQAHTAHLDFCTHLQPSLCVLWRRCLQRSAAEGPYQPG
eukprot:m.49008 g.49008  ORF g.49008 m.49008 type:complete len:214 (+) comp6458_c0_seq1:37-678(+)